MDGTENIDFERWSHELWHKLQECRAAYDAIESFRGLPEIPPDCQRARLVAISSYSVTFRVMTSPELMALPAPVSIEDKKATFKEASRAINEFGRLMRELMTRINSS